MSGHIEEHDDWITRGLGLVVLFSIIIIILFICFLK